MHPCFDGLNGELAHAFLPPRGEIHFDNHEFWILGKSRFSWKQGADLIHLFMKVGGCAVQNTDITLLNDYTFLELRNFDRWVALIIILEIE